MSENIENLVLEHLRHMRAAVDRIERRLDDLTIGVHLETSFAHEQSIRFASVEARLTPEKGLNWPMRKVPS